MTRTAARELAVQLCFRLSVDGELNEETLERFFEDEHYESLAPENDCFQQAPDEKQLAYIREVTQGVAARQAELDAYIEKYAVGWKLGRISRMSLSIMRLCLYEAEHIDDVPVAVAINEAVELAKKYDTEAAPAFINGILNAALKDKEKTE